MQPESSSQSATYMETMSLRRAAAEARTIGRLLQAGDYRTSAHRAESLLINYWNLGISARLNPSNTVTCNCCGWQGKAFLAGANWRAVTPQNRCPQCGACSRHRGLAHLLPDLLREKPPGPVLLFAPEPMLLPVYQAWSEGEIITADFARTDVDITGLDIQRLSLADDSISFIGCNHVLEHVPDDQTAMFECARVLVPGGVAVFTVPGDFSRRETWTFDAPDDTGHYRHYGLDILDKLTAAFAQVTPLDMNLVADPQWRVRPLDFAFICRN